VVRRRPTIRGASANDHAPVKVAAIQTPAPGPASNQPAVAPAVLRFAPVDAILAQVDRGRTVVAHPGRPWRSVAWLARDPLMALSVALAVPVLVVDIVDPPAVAWPSLALTVGFVAVQAILSRQRRLPRAIPLLRFILSLAFLLAASVAIDAHGGWPLLALGIPVVALAAVGDASVWVAVAAVGMTLLPVVLPATSGDVRRRLIALAMASIVTAIGSRRVVASLERSRDRLRRAQTLQRRRTRQLGAVESVGQILAREGPTPEALDSVVGLLNETFGYGLPSLYLWDGRVLRLGAQRNYATPITEFPIERGVIGRVARTREAVFLPDVTADPEYVAADAEVRGEMSVPLLTRGDLLGVLNVETGGPRRLDGDDFATLQIVADRLAESLALGRERQRLTERAGLMDRLASFSRSLGRTLDPATLHGEVGAGARRVVAADMAILIVLDRPSGEFRIVQVDGGDPALLGARILPGEGVSGRAIAAGTVIVDDRLHRGAFPRDASNAKLADTLAAMSAALVVDETVTGALSWFREDLTLPFSEQEREVGGLLAAQVALALSNAELHQATAVAAVTDALTGLHNRRHFDASMARAEAARRREPEADRRERSAIIFDLDHFGRINKLYGHGVGDRFLRAFADVLRARVRASDLAARYGGEEFVVVLDGATREDAVRMADEVRLSFGGLRFALPDGSHIGCTVSAGCSALIPSETDGALLLERADVGLAMAKAGGRDRVVAA
jgi:diguanylate cyclase (GGDEF)-like protein